MNVMKFAILSMIAPNYAKYLHEEQLINFRFKSQCKRYGIDDVAIEKMKNEARELSIHTVNTYEYCLASLLYNKLKEK